MRSKWVTYELHICIYIWVIYELYGLWTNYMWIKYEIYVNKCYQMCVYIYKYVHQLWHLYDSYINHTNLVCIYIYEIIYLHVGSCWRTMMLNDVMGLWHSLLVNTHTSYIYMSELHIGSTGGQQFFLDCSTLCHKRRSAKYKFVSQFMSISG